MALIQSQHNSDYLTFDEEKHEYTLNGKVVPGPSTFVKGGMPSSMALTGWMVGQGASYAIEQVLSGRTDVEKVIRESKTAYRTKAEEAASIGTIVHDFAHLTELGKGGDAARLRQGLEKDPRYPSIEKAVRNFESWRAENTGEVLQLEQIVASTKFGFAGKFDRLEKRGGKNIICDYKTSTGIYLDMFLQLAAYKIAIEEWLEIPIHGMEILRFGKTGDFETLMIKKPSEIKEFERQTVLCHKTWDFNREWSADKRFSWKGKKK